MFQHMHMLWRLLLLSCMQGCAVLYPWSSHGVLRGEIQTIWVPYGTQFAECICTADAGVCRHWFYNGGKSVAKCFQSGCHSSERKPAAVSLPVVQGLLAGRNDYQLLKQGSIRDINRHSYR